METAKSKEGYLTLFSVIGNYLLKLFVTDDNVATVDADIRNLNQGSLTVIDYAQQLWMKTLRHGSVYNVKILKGLSVKGVHRSICGTLRQRWSEHQHILLEDLNLKTEPLNDLQGNKLRSYNKPETVNNEDRRTTHNSHQSRKS